MSVRARNFVSFLASLAIHANKGAIEGREHSDDVIVVFQLIKAKRSGHVLTIRRDAACSSLVSDLRVIEENSRQQDRTSCVMFSSWNAHQSFVLDRGACSCLENCRLSLPLTRARFSHEEQEGKRNDLARSTITVVFAWHRENVERRYESGKE